MSSTRHAHPIALAWAIVRRHFLLFSAIWLVVTAAGVAYALVMPRLWPVTTALTIREETGLSQLRPGEFASPEARRKAQETVLQLVSSTSVLRDALARAIAVDASRITSDDIEQAQRRVRLAPPKGVDWGASEVIYLTAKDEDAARAKFFSQALVAELDLRLKELRRKRTEGLASELEQTLRMAETDLRLALEKIGKMEAQLGADLAEMRIMTEPSAGESNLRRTLTEVENELRQTRSQIDGNRSLLELLESARKDPTKLIATPSRLLESQPSLRKMKEGIVDSENRTAQLMANLHQSHPKVKAAKTVEEQARQQLFTELGLAVDGVKVEIQVGQKRLTELTARRVEIEDRLGRLAEVRAEYGLLSTQVKDRSDVVKRTRDQLSEVNSSHAAADTSSVLASVDAPLAGLRPEGPGRTTVVLLAFAAGLILALGAVAALTPSAQWREVFELSPSAEERLALPSDHGVLAAWFTGAKPYRRERLASPADSTLTAKQ